MSAVVQELVGLDLFEDLLKRICGNLTLTEAKREEAVRRYEAVGTWLTAEGSRIASWNPEIYAQGSLRIGTTVRPRGQNAFDLDIVCEFKNPDPRIARPETMLNSLEERLRENDHYRSMIERKNRCVRLVYTDEFHLDILPAEPDLESPIPDAVLVPDREMQEWKPSNPKGYIQWFERRSRLVLTKDKRDVTPIPAAQAEPLPLVHIVQLLKRWRDVQFEEKEVAISIVLTTLAARHYNGGELVRAGFTTILSAIEQEIADARLLRRRVKVLNPANDEEDLSERWDDTDLYLEFVEGFHALLRGWNLLASRKGIPEVVEVLCQLFGKDVVLSAVRQQAEAVQNHRERKNLGITPAGRLATSNKGRPIPRNTFYGD